MKLFVKYIEFCYEMGPNEYKFVYRNKFGYLSSFSKIGI